MFLGQLGNEDTSHWTGLTAQCYKRNCICKGCNLIPLDLKKQFLVKSYVLINYRKYGKPEKNYLLERMEEV